MHQCSGRDRAPQSLGGTEPRASVLDVVGLHPSVTCSVFKHRVLWLTVGGPAGTSALAGVGPVPPAREEQDVDVQQFLEAPGRSLCISPALEHILSPRPSAPYGPKAPGRETTSTLLPSNIPRVGTVSLSVLEVERHPRDALR